ncbi:MAG: DUF3617 family protein [Rhodocyclaceae bacterium]|nr:DUF3617 family protein [Rhodocyclaceae bacterium]
MFLVGSLNFPLSLQATEPAQINLKEGLWRLSVEMEIPGRGPETGPLTQDICLRPNEVTKLAVPPNSPCQIHGLEISHRRMRWKISCEQYPMRSSGEGLMEFGGKQLTSALVMQTAPPYAMRIKQSITGRYLSPCPASAATGVAPLQPYKK